MQKGIGIFFIVVILFASCIPARKDGNYGVLIYKTRHFDSASNNYTRIVFPFPLPDNKIWYKDSLVIQEDRSIRTYSDFFDGETMSTSIHHYTFINLSTREYYRYLNFSDMATVIKQFIGPDSLGTDGRWYPFSTDDRFTAVKNSLPDTTFNGIKYERKIYSRIFHLATEIQVLRELDI